MKLNKYLLLLFVFCFSQINWVARKVISREIGSQFGLGIYSEVFDIYRLLPTVTYMQTRVAQELAQKIAMRSDVNYIFDLLDESVFKNEIRRQYFLMKNGEVLDDVRINFSVMELLNAGFFDEKIEEAKKSGILDLSNFNIDNLNGLSNLFEKVSRPITELNLSHNDLYEIWYSDLRNNSTRITKLDLSYNKIWYLEPRCFDSLHELKFLDLGHNKFTSLPEYIFSELTKLEKLDLSDNKIEKLNNYIFIGLLNLKQLNLADNPLGNNITKDSLGLLKLEELYLK